jgi:putative intracellular protease/amidase
LDRDHGGALSGAEKGDDAMLIGMPLYNQVNMLDVTGAYEMFRWAKFTVELVAETPRHPGEEMYVSAGAYPAPPLGSL